jgi:cytochrome d ubiquinol oxidase subunit I
LFCGFILVSVVYLFLTVASVYVLRRLAKDKPVPLAPQESDVTGYNII